MISLIIPTYNRNDQLAECLASVRANSSFDNEIIILHPLPDIEITNLCKKYKAISMIDNSRQQGRRIVSLWGIINRGIEAAKHRFVCWLNDDCLVLPNWDIYGLNYFRDAPHVGLVVLRTKGIGGDPTFRTVKAFYDIDCANYGILDKETGIRFDELFSWFYGDADIAVQAKIRYAKKVVATIENCVIHNHLEDENRIQNETDPRSLADQKRFEHKWKKYRYWDNAYISRNKYIQKRAITLFRRGLQTIFDRIRN